jgi:molybdopterin converting factor small subunit
VRADIAVSVDGEVSAEGLRRKVEPGSEVHFLPAMSGGA